MASPVPRDYFHHDDIEIGRVLRLGPRRVETDEIIAFALKYDPQPMHTDPEAAKTSPIGRLCASGYHTAAIMMRMMCDGLVLRSASLGSPGIDSCKWLKPVFPGDELYVEIVATDARVLGSRPNVGISKMVYTTRTADGAAVMEMHGSQFMRIRDPKPSAVLSPSTAERTAEKTTASAAVDLWKDHPQPLPPVPVSGLFLEDRTVGETIELGNYTFEREDTIEFARAFDPQLFHLDEAAAKASLFGGLSASGWQTAAIHLKLLLAERDGRIAKARAQGIPIASIGPSPGFQNLKWLRPVLCGDTISYRSRTVGARPLSSNPKRGLVSSLTQGRNQRGELVFTVEGSVFCDRRARSS
jgi:acyl dehydratase